MKTPPSQQPDPPKLSRLNDGIGALSIHQRARRYPRARIISEPLLWTKLHLDLLRCGFEGPRPAPPVVMKLDDPEDNERMQRPPNQPIYHLVLGSYLLPSPRKFNCFAISYLLDVHIVLQPG
ncbi:hypothetical protein HRG_012512 [Hirsutella rhossiliensis]